MNNFVLFLLAIPLGLLYFAGFVNLNVILLLFGSYFVYYGVNAIGTQKAQTQYGLWEGPRAVFVGSYTLLFGVAFVGLAVLSMLNIISLDSIGRMISGRS